MKAGTKAREERRKVDPEFDRDYRAKLSESQSGEKHSGYGTMWITNGKDTRKIPKGDLIPDGFKPGRTMKRKENN